MFLSGYPAAPRVHPDVLELRWLIHATEEKWDVCLDLATAITKQAPEAASGWIHRSFALHELKRTEEARDNLLDVIASFPDHATLRYNLACYETQLERPNLALGYLEKAFDLDDTQDLMVLALEDPDLKPLWERIGKAHRI